VEQQVLRLRVMPTAPPRETATGHGLPVTGDGNDQRRSSQEDAMPTRPDDETKKTEKEDAAVTAGADRPPTAEEEAIADALPEVDEEVAESYKEMAERGAGQEGEGRLP
jgi:hypothetical protein